MSQPRENFRIGNMAASRADRPDAMADLLAGGAMDVLAVDMLSDEAMLVLAADRAEGRAGYEEALLTQLERCADRLGEGGVRIVTNAGALDPAGLAERVRELGGRLGVELAVAHLDPGDALDRADSLDVEGAAVVTVRHGAFGISRALETGAHIVITGRVSREALITGAAAWYHQWTPAYLDALAGAVAIGHVLSGGPGATGVVDSSTDITRAHDPVTGGYPIAEIDDEGACVITKHPSAFGSVTVGTLTDQLLDGVVGARYVAPDVVLRLDSVALEQEGTDRVRMSGALGESPTPEVSVTAVYSSESEGGRRRAARTLPQEQAGHSVVLPDGTRSAVPPPPRTEPLEEGEAQGLGSPVSLPGGEPRPATLGAVAGVQSGAVGRGLNLAVWTWDDTAFAWLLDELTVESLLALLPEIEGARLERHALPNLRAVNFVVTPTSGGRVGEQRLPADLELARRLRDAALDIPAELLEVAP